MTTDQQFWDTRYAGKDRLWSGKPNPALVRETSGLAPGHALDLGCGEGADAIWLASRGWRVTAVDISGVALERAAAHAAAAGVADLIDWQRHDLGHTFPEGGFDLVSAQFLHSHGDMPRERILRTAAEAVNPGGGVLLIVGHSEGQPGHEDHADLHLPTPGEVLRSLELTDEQWEVLVSEEFTQPYPGPDGEEHTRTNNTLKVRRL
ncbi:class I SAM-dependent methyltransferase [Nonomuraea sp. NPDC048916]|uniref:class I SAM-dependent methyltransferase n=1 Tax=Nonomuraea sp. NPDC048916 TaxID=3154232 RepID=UPI0033F56400